MQLLCSEGELTAALLTVMEGVGPGTQALLGITVKGVKDTAGGHISLLCTSPGKAWLAKHKSGDGGAYGPGKWGRHEELRVK